MAATTTTATTTTTTTRSDPDPSLVLETIRTLLLPTPIISSFPTVLQLFAHLQLVSAQITSEARRALEAQERLSAQLLRAGVPYEELVAHGSLAKADGETLERLSERQGREDEMMDLSFNIRLTHIAMILSSPQGVPNERCRVLVDAYFPRLDGPDRPPPPALAPETVEHWLSRCKRNRMCYVRAMTEDQFWQLQFWREKVHDVWERAVRAHREGRRPRLQELLPNIQSRQLLLLIGGLLELAEAVVDDVDAFESIFEPRASQVHVDQPATVQLEVQDAPEPLITHVRTTGHSSPPPIRAPPGTATVSRPSVLARQFGTPAAKAKRPRPFQSPYLLFATHVHRTYDEAGGPDFTAPLPPSSIDKTKLKPFDDSQLQRTTPKRPRQSVESGSATRPKKRARGEAESVEA